MMHSAAKAPVEFALDCLVDYSLASLKAELRRVAALVDGRPLTIRRFREHARISHSSIVRRFGGWSRALAAAGLGDRRSGRSVTAKMRAQAARRMSDAEILAELRLVMRRRRLQSLRVADLDAGCRVGYRAICARFGSWRAALAQLGLTPVWPRRRYSDADYFDNLRRVWTARGRRPRWHDLARPPSRIRIVAYQQRFGGLRRALQAFVAHEAARGQPAAGPPPPPPSRPLPPPPAPPARPCPTRDPAQRRAVPLSLRYAVLRRDRYACVACGDSPAKGTGCTLEIDHIVPFSRGGLTVLENLRALCQCCNRGKGARTGDEAGGTAAAASRRPRVKEMVTGLG